MSILTDYLGMFLYARLVCDSIDLLGDIDSIKEAVENLPEGLNEASVPQVSLRTTWTNTHTDTTEFFPESQMVCNHANAMMLGRFWHLSLAL